MFAATMKQTPVVKKTTTRKTHSLSSSVLLRPVALKKKVVETAHPPGGPQNPKPEKRPNKDRNLKGQNSNNRDFSPELPEQNQTPDLSQTRTKQNKTICTEELCLHMRGGGAHGPPRISEVTGWGPGHRMSKGSSRPGNRPTQASITRSRK